MNESKSQPEFIDIDLDQWKRDINTFAVTTQQAIDAIVSELSNQCSGMPGSIKDRPTKTRSVNTTKPTKPSVAPRKPAITDIPQPNSGTTSEGGDQRLADLKLKLAERLAKANKK